MAPDEQDILAAAGITDADFGEADETPEVSGETAPAEQSAPEAEATGPLRDEHGRFAPKPAPEVAAAPEAAPTPAPAAPEPDISGQFREDVRAAFAALDPAIKGEVSRRIGELQGGLEEHRQRWEPLKKFDQMAQAGGTTLAAALAQYTTIEQTLARNPMEGLDLICRNLGTDIRTVAAQIMGQPAPEANAQVSQLRQRLDAAERELQGYRAERQQTTLKTVEEFFTANPRANELSRDIAWLVQQGFNLQEAYRRAEALNPVSPGPQTANIPSPQTAPPAAPHTPPANLSISGSPSGGSTPAARAPELRGMEATKWAFQQAGL